VFLSVPRLLVKLQQGVFLTRQYKDPQHHVGAYWQISYTRLMRSRTEYVRKEWVRELRRQIATHKRFKRIDRWLDLSIEHS
jgi:hypothetical protein